MKVYELINQHQSATKIEQMLSTMDWNYDLDPFDDKRFYNGEDKLKNIKSELRAMASVNEDVAKDIWQNHYPWAYQTQFRKFIE